MAKRAKYAGPTDEQIIGGIFDLRGGIVLSLEKHTILTAPQLPQRTGRITRSK